MSLRDDIKAIQRAVNAEPDGVFGPMTAARVMLALKLKAEPVADAAIDERTLKVISTLDVKAHNKFLKFVLLAKATAATLGCDYVALSGTRTMEEQDVLHRKSLAGGPHAAAPGFSWHNFGIAVDFGVFQGNGKIYCDEARPSLAEKVHAACAVHARDCGLEWGGTWTGKSNDPPHYQINMGHSIPTAADRAAFREEGTVL